MSVIVSFARTPIGKLSGSLASLTATALGGIAISGALTRAQVEPGEVDYVFMGHVLQAGQGQITARQAAVAAGIPMAVPATTVNKVCLSGLNAVFLADMLISSGRARVVVAGGMESMTQAPYLLPGARAGLRMGNVELVDSMLYDGLFCAFDHQAMGEATDHYLAGFRPLPRARQDAFAALSHERAALAAKEGRLAEEIVPVTVPQRKGDPLVVEADEGVRPGTTTETLSRLRPAFVEGGSITAGNASQISDGAAALVVMSEEEAARRSLSPIAKILGFGQVAGPDPSLLLQPANAIRQAAQEAGVAVDQLALLEINEAFAAVALASMDDLGIDEGHVNVNGGAIALGHPVGASGARILGSLALELRRRGGGLGAAGLCGGGGQGDAMVIRVD
jgi:acetyl-CoA C-acetyltransferase